MEDITHQQRQAFKRIELIAQWEGRLNTNQLTESLGITRQSASKLINEYKAFCPHNLAYNNQQKCYEPTAEFSPRISSGLLDDYIAISPNVAGAHLSDIPTHASLLRLGSGHNTPAASVVRPIIQAIKNRQRLDIAYASITSPDFEERIISPHTLIHDGHRWHTRAWCEKNNDFRDFVLTRIRDVFNREGPAEQGREQDTGWNTWIEFSIEPDPRLDNARRTIVALDYGMQPNASGTLQRHYRVRAALLIYWLQQLRVDRYRERPEAQQIILSPYSQRELESWLPR